MEKEGEKEKIVIRGRYNNSKILEKKIKMSVIRKRGGNNAKYRYERLLSSILS